MKMKFLDKIKIKVWIKRNKKKKKWEKKTIHHLYEIWRENQSWQRESSLLQVTCKCFKEEASFRINSFRFCFCFCFHQSHAHHLSFSFFLNFVSSFILSSLVMLFCFVSIFKNLISGLIMGKVSFKSVYIYKYLVV